jgi:hypothetical protein
MHFHTIDPSSTSATIFASIANVIKHRHAFGLVNNRGATKRRRRPEVLNELNAKCGLDCVAEGIYCKRHQELGSTLPA